MVPLGPLMYLDPDHGRYTLTRISTNNNLAYLMKCRLSRHVSFSADAIPRNIFVEIKIRTAINALSVGAITAIHGISSNSDYIKEVKSLLGGTRTATFLGVI